MRKLRALLQKVFKGNDRQDYRAELRGEEVRANDTIREQNRTFGTGSDSSYANRFTH